MAAMEYGAVYDETEALGSVELTYQGEQKLPQLTEALGVDLRVDVFTDEGVEDISVSDIAVYVYENSGYRCCCAARRTAFTRFRSRTGACTPSSIRRGAARRSCPALFTMRCRPIWTNARGMART